MSGTKDRRKALMPRLATTGRTATSPRSSPSPTPRTPALSTFSQSSAKSNTRRPLSVIGTSASSRQSPSSGRSTPIKPIVASNTNPRSGARLGRTQDSRSQSPAVNQSPTEYATIRSRVAARSGLSEQVGSRARPLPFVCPRLHVSKDEKSGFLFVHADEVPPQQLAEKFMSKKTTSFVYANGEEEEENALEVNQLLLESRKSLHSNGIANSQSRSEPYGPTTSVSTIAAKFEPPRRVPPMPSQSATPISVHTVVPPKPQTTTPTRPALSAQSRLPSQGTVPQLMQARHVSREALVTHPNTKAAQAPSQTRKSCSSSSGDVISPLPTTQAKHSSQGLTSSTVQPVSSPESYSKRSSLNHASPHLCPTSPAATSTLPTAVSPVQSAGHSNSPVHDQNTTKDIASSARHERKLLDLEISNSSLLAINRSLEREMMKQKAELRRMRRATNNRASWMSDATIEEEVDSVISGDGDENSDAGLRFGIDEESSRRSSSRRVSSKRLQLDLEKYKQVLVDGQKMNLSIQRCLGITDQLIKDADKALEYRVYLGSSLLEDEDKEGKCEGEDGIYVDESRFLGMPSPDERDVEADVFFKTWGGLSPRRQNVSRDAVSLAGKLESHAKVEEKVSGVDVECDENSLSWAGYHSIHAKDNLEGEDADVKTSRAATLSEMF